MILDPASRKAKPDVGINNVTVSVEEVRALENKGEVCLEEEVEKRRRSGMSTDEIAQEMGVDPTWVQSLVSMTEGNSSEESREPEEAEA